MGAWLYILQCADGAYYTGTTRAELEKRVAEHHAGSYPGFTAKRRPVVLVYSEFFEQIVDAIAAERQIKGWSRAKKEALVAGDFQRITQLSQRRTPFKPHGSRRVARKSAIADLRMQHCRSRVNPRSVRRSSP